MYPFLKFEFNSQRMYYIIRYPNLTVNEEDLKILSRDAL